MYCAFSFAEFKTEITWIFYAKFLFNITAIHFKEENVLIIILIVIINTRDTEAALLCIYKMVSCI